MAAGELNGARPQSGKLVSRMERGEMVWRLRRLARGLNLPLGLAFGIAVFGTVFYFSTLAPLLDEREQLREQLAQRVALREATPQPATATRDPQADLAAFYVGLAREADVPDQLRRLHRAAQSQGLRLAQSQYRPLPDPGGKLTRYQILLPARGSYPEIRSFLAQASREVPGLALEGIRFQRRDIGEAELDAQIRFTLFITPGGIPERMALHAGDGR